MLERGDGNDGGMESEYGGIERVDNAVGTFNCGTTRSFAWTTGIINPSSKSLRCLSTL